MRSADRRDPRVGVTFFARSAGGTPGVSPAAAAGTAALPIEPAALRLQTLSGLGERQGFGKSSCR
jgi:hypothetical protein